MFAAYVIFALIAFLGCLLLFTNTTVGTPSRVWAWLMFAAACVASVVAFSAYAFDRLAWLPPVPQRANPTSLLFGGSFLKH